MKKAFVVIIFFLSSVHICMSGTYTTIRSGDWNNTSTWSGGAKAPVSGGNNIDYIHAGDDVTLTGSITYENNCELHVYGNLTITGNLIAKNNLVIDVTGSLTVNGNLESRNGAAIDISGEVNVTGDVTSQNNGTINLTNGTLDIGGTLTGGSDCEINGTGIINIQGANNFDTTPAIGVDVNPALPVEFIGLTYKIKSNNIELKWETASEIFNNYFTIEKSKNGINFEIIGTVQGAGYSNYIVKYNFYDENITDGICYYRLKQTDYDGTTVILKTIACKIAPDKNTLITFQNPIVDQTFQINYTGESGKYILNVYNVNGQIILSKENISDNNSGTFNINRSGLKGYYFISVTDPLGNTRSYPIIFN